MSSPPFPTGMGTTECDTDTFSQTPPAHVRTPLGRAEAKLPTPLDHPVRTGCVAGRTITRNDGGQSWGARVSSVWDAWASSVYFEKYSLESATYQATSWCLRIKEWIQSQDPCPQRADGLEGAGTGFQFNTI